MSQNEMKSYCLLHHRFKNHEQSKKHREKMQQLRAEMDEELMRENTGMHAVFEAETEQRGCFQCAFIATFLIIVYLFCFVCWTILTFSTLTFIAGTFYSLRPQRVCGQFLSGARNDTTNEMLQQVTATCGLSYVFLWA